MSYAPLHDPRSSFHPPDSSQMRSFFVKKNPKAPVSSVRRRKLFLSYLPDWILTIVLAAIFFSLDKVEGYRREFSVTDTSLRHPYDPIHTNGTSELIHSSVMQFTNASRTLHFI
ncbi:hypothetical protein H2248_009905 [Termitomyces sp. 'cryptogamus']|nr:hypothetical protein H2248_009905 [Termitomyces sp. 'cryptogamus']